MPVQVTSVLVLYFPLQILWAAVRQPEGSTAWLRTFPECLLWNIFKGLRKCQQFTSPTAYLPLIANQIGSDTILAN